MKRTTQLKAMTAFADGVAVGVGVTCRYAAQGTIDPETTVVRTDVGMPLTSCDAERRVVVVEAPHDRRPLVDGSAGRDEPFALADFARLDRRLPAEFRAALRRYLGLVCKIRPAPELAADLVQTLDKLRSHVSRTTGNYRFTE